MFKKIVVALDRSDISQQIFEQGLALAKMAAANLMLVHVLSAEEEGSPEIEVFPTFDYYPGLSNQGLELYHKRWETFKAESLQMLQNCCSQANTAEINAEFTQNLGSPGRMICEVARTWDADLIVMGRRGRFGIQELILGSVSNYVLHHAPCSVHIVHLPVKSQMPESIIETPIPAVLTK
jgi:nucleotide-binding universal stress UspA family protein